MLSVCPEELRLMAVWTVVRPKTMKTSRRKGFVVSAWRSLCCSDGVSFAPARVCHFLTRGLVKLTTKARRERFVLLVCVCVCAFGFRIESRSAGASDESRGA